jgi:hypothetical protein
MCFPFGRMSAIFSLAIAQWNAIRFPRGDQAGESQLPKAFVSRRWPVPSARIR